MIPQEVKDKNIEQWKVKRLIKTLDSMKGNGTSLISLILSPKDQISRVSKMLGEEAGTASHIKSRINRLSVLSAITSIQHKLSLYSKVPNNGLAIYCGCVETLSDTKTKKVIFDFEPIKEVTSSMYLCDNRFHTEPLQAMLDSDEIYGFVIIDGNGCLLATLSGNVKTILHKFTIDLPKKHGRGGQSAPRFARIRMGKRHRYVKKVGEILSQYFISDNKVNVNGLIFAGSADFKSELYDSDNLDKRLKSCVISLVDVSYGGENGLSQAITLSEDMLYGVKLIEEQRLLNEFMDHISKDTGKYCFGIKQTFMALEMGAIETLIVNDDLDVERYVIYNISKNETEIKYLSNSSELDNLYNDSNDQLYEIQESQPLVEWLVNNYSLFGCKLEFISNKSQSGFQFCKGFGGFGGILRYKVDFMDFDYESDDDDDFNDN